MSIHILFCGDDGVREGVFLSALSICRTVTRPVTFYLLTAGVGERRALSPQFAERLERRLRQAGTDHRVILTDISETFARYLPLANMDTRFTPLCMLRLFADITPEIPDRVLYLDTDVLCRADFSELYELDMTGCEIAGVPDRYGKWFFGNFLKHNYLNSGVLLLNMAEIRKSGLFQRCRTLCREKKMFMPDQTALNKMAVKRKIPVRYNEQGRIRKDTVFKHFTTFFRFVPRFRAVTVKPWEPERLHSELRIYEFDDLIEDGKRSLEHE